jgi:hypothetical protein
MTSTQPTPTRNGHSSDPMAHSPISASNGPQSHAATPTSHVQDTAQFGFASQLLRPWIVANFIAFAIGAGIAGGMLRALEDPYYGSNVSVMEAARIQATATGASAAIFGAILGTAQWFALRRVIRATWWMPATFVGWALAGPLFGFNAGGSISTIGPDAGPLPTLLYAPLALTAVVLLLGSVQWLVLRRAFHGAGPWPLVNVGAMVVGLIIGFVIAKMLPFLAPTDYPSARALAIVGAVAGPVYGWLTWQFFAQLRRRVG